MVSEQDGSPTYGKYKNDDHAWREWKENGWDKPPSEVDSILGWQPYKEGDIKKDGVLYIGFTKKSGQRRMVWVYKYWWGLKEGNYSFIQSDQKSKLIRFFGDPLEKGICVASNTPLSIPFDEGNHYYADWGCGDRTKKAGFQTEWNGKYGVVRQIRDADKSWVAVTYQSQKLHNARAPFPPAGKLSNLNLSAGKDKSSVDTYGQKVESTQDSRIDGIRNIPWGATPDEVINSSFGNPKHRNGREIAKKFDISLPDEGKSVWVYEEEIIGSSATTWLAFENSHDPSNPGLIWAATLWRELESDDHDRITSEISTILEDDYGDPKKTDEGNLTEREAPNFTGLSNWTSAKLWEDDYGRLLYVPRTYHHGTQGRIAVYYQSQALLEKRQSSVQDAEAKF
jgi:hypothetical protein